jgi:hypothetical protein
MPSAGGHGVISSYYRNCVAVASGHLETTTSGVHACNPTAALPSTTVLPEPVLNSLAEYAPTVSGHVSGVHVGANVTHQDVKEATSPEVAVSAALLDVTMMMNPTATPDQSESWSLGSIKRAPFSFLRRAAPVADVNRFMQLRGFLLTSVPFFSEHTDVDGDSRTGHISCMKRLFLLFYGGQARYRRAFVLSLLTPSPIVLPVFYAGIFVVEIAANVDLYPDGSFLSVPETLTTLIVLLVLFLFGCVRVLASRFMPQCTCHKEPSVPVSGTDATVNDGDFSSEQRCLLHRHCGPFFWDSVAVVLSWSLLLIALAVQAVYREQSSNDFCGRYVRASVWGIVVGTGRK